MSKDARSQYLNSLIAERIVSRVAARTAMEHDTPEAMAKYLKEHPDADRSNHTVKNKPHGGKGDGKIPSDYKGEIPNEYYGDKPNHHDKPKAVKVHPDTVKALRQLYTQKTQDHDLGAWGGKNNALRDLINHAGKGGAVSKGDVDRALSFLKNQRAGEGRTSARTRLDEVKRQLEHVRSHL